MSGSWRRSAAALTAWIAAGSVATWVVRRWLFPNGTPVLDEQVYRQQAAFLRNGQLIVPEWLRSDQRLFFTGPRSDGRLIFKYLPSWAAVLAVGDVVASPEVVIAVVAGLAALAIAFFAREVSGSIAVGVAAAVLCQLTPFWQVQSATGLTYVPGAALGCVAAGALVGAARRGSAGWAVVSGASSVAHVSLRPLDAVLWAGVAVCVVAALRLSLGRWVRWWVGAIAVFGGALVLFNRWLTGTWTSLPFSVVGPDDTLGFGVRRELPSAPAVEFGVGKAWEGLRHQTVDLVRVAPIVAVVVGFVAVDLVTRVGRPARRESSERVPNRERAMWVVFAAAAAFVAIYAIFWGSWNAAVRFGVTKMVGPFYLLPVLVLAVVGGVSLVERRMAGAGGTGWPAHPPGPGPAGPTTPPPRRLAAALAVVTVTVVVAGGVTAWAGPDAPVDRLRAERDRLAARAEVVEQVGAQSDRGLAVLPGSRLNTIVPMLVGPDRDDTPQPVLRLGRSLDEIAALDERAVANGVVVVTDAYSIGDGAARIDRVDALGFARVQAVSSGRRTVAAEGRVAVRLEPTERTGSARPVGVAWFADTGWVALDDDHVDIAVTPDGIVATSVDRQRRLDLPEPFLVGTPTPPAMCAGTLHDAAPAGDARITCLEATSRGGAVVGWWSVPYTLRRFVAPESARWLPVGEPAAASVTTATSRETGE